MMRSVMQRDGRLRVNSVVSDNGGWVNGRTKNGKLMKTEKKRKTKRSEETRNSKAIYITTPCLRKKNCANSFLSELRQTSTNFKNFWQKDGKEAKIMQGALNFHLTQFASSHYRVKRRCSNLLHHAESCYLQ